MSLLNLLFPKRCCGCKRFGSYFCRECILSIIQAGLVCPACEKPSIGGETHPLCQRKYGLDGLWSLGVYKPPLKQAIQKLKYRFVSQIALSLIDLTVEYLARFTPYFLEQIRKERGKDWIAVPAPLHPKRQKFRGFNQSALLGQLLSKKMGLDYQEALKRVRHTRPQVGLESWARTKNIKGAFALAKGQGLTAKNVLLIDDVWTTGSTLKECAYVLKRGGAKKVWAITLAR